MEGKLSRSHTTAGVVKPIILKANIALLEGHEMRTEYVSENMSNVARWKCKKR
jgi:hypothetical protein